MKARLRELTPRGPGGVSVLQLEGPDALALARRWSGVELEAGELRLVRLSVADEDLDEALVVALSAERVEFHVHGSPPLVSALMGLLPPDAGDGVAASDQSIEARALRLLANAPCEFAARALLAQAEGALRRALEAVLEAPAEAWRRDLEAIARRSRTLQLAIEPPRVVLAGPVNAGKSTLFNLLLGGERVITSEQAGTTRDVVVERVLLGPWPVDLVDTAGEREVGGGADGARVERAGQELARRARDSADLVLWLTPPGSRERPPASAGRCVALTSRADLASDSEDGISVERDPAAALERVIEVFCAAFDLPSTPRDAHHAAVFDAAGRASLDNWIRQGPRSSRAGIESLIATS